MCEGIIGIALQSRVSQLLVCLPNSRVEHADHAVPSQTIGDFACY